jgi:hypothetical protein
MRNNAIVNMPAAATYTLLAYQCSLMYAGVNYFDEAKTISYSGATWLGGESMTNNGRVLFGDGTAGAAQACAIAEFRSTTQGVCVPRMTGAQITAIASPVAGLDVFNSTTNKRNFYNGAAWVEYGLSYASSAPTLIAYTAGTTTPSIAGAGPVAVMYIANTSATSITNFTGASGNGQLLICIFADANTTVTRASAHLDGGVPYTSAAFATLALVYYAGVWYQVGKVPANN